MMVLVGTGVSVKHDEVVCVTSADKKGQINMAIQYARQRHIVSSDGELDKFTFQATSQISELVEKAKQAGDVQSLILQQNAAISVSDFPMEKIATILAKPEKLNLVCYVDIGELAANKIKSYLEEFRETIRVDGMEEPSLFIPVRSRRGDPKLTRLEKI
jgi:hypothetical protein